MIRRLYNIVRSNVKHIVFYSSLKTSQNSFEKWDQDFLNEADFQNLQEDELETTCQALEPYYANLEIPTGSNRKEVKKAWRSLIKKYHPDLYSADPEKRKTANELTRRLTESYQILDKALIKKD